MRASAPMDHLPGLDLPGFLSRFDGNFVLLAGLLPRFVEATEARIALLSKHLASDDLGEVAAVLHQLRGAAANVGANDIANLASRAEEALAHEGIEALRPLPGALTEAMIPLREAAAIVAALPAAPEEGPTEGDASLSVLQELVRTYNMRALDMVKECAASLTAALGKEQADSVTSAIQALDFEGAYGKLSRQRSGDLG